ncbi:DUF6894 family protein [Bradyrhizobium arachidis]|jgi:hypothetical protein|uniref:DUF6894 domain-containing protein n=1 Tax=Bradyrhizobium arachidis TaxID=858423 RepID=A0AAE7TEW6_9BRAD|nr:hypothetical protein [Bradyrhizobium arachidis]QOZ65905.1 hypothetical protein WN72_05340 [Bradyrhizobium arachidis]
MPRFFFDIHDTREITMDDDGIDLTGTDAVRRLAMEALAQAILDGANECSTGTTKVVVRDTIVVSCCGPALQ